IFSQLVTLIRDAEEAVVLISPYVSISKLRDLIREIQVARQRKIEVTLFIRAEDGSTRVSETNAASLVELSRLGVEVRQVQDLHAKLYLSEKYAIVTSLNLLESSINNSLEIAMGVPATHPEHRQLMAFVQEEILPVSSVYEASGASEKQTAGAREKPAPVKAPPPPVIPAAVGHCIRCGGGIAFDPERPYCNGDYAKWARYKDEDYEDSFCHSCGNEFGATMRKPLCRSCYRKLDAMAGGR
ncbi:MAG TPA: phospholipase D-like domain-containing protein, partial [Myxococcaceae bacterium]|nr:phospholipase D-like domain-containing protein [Myxococcaceae bacterium]